MRKHSLSDGDERRDFWRGRERGRSRIGTVAASRKTPVRGSFPRCLYTQGVVRDSRYNRPRRGISPGNSSQLTLGPFPFSAITL